MEQYCKAQILEKYIC